jgi:hypothetical protein
MEENVQENLENVPQYAISVTSDSIGKLSGPQARFHILFSGTDRFTGNSVNGFGLGLIHRADPIS